MSRIFLVGRKSAMTMLRPLSERLRECGHEPHLHRSPCVLRDLPGWESADLLIPIASECDGRDIAAAPKLRGIVTPAVGIDTIDIDAATRHGVLVANGELWENQTSLAEAMFMLMIAGLYDLHGSQRTMWPGTPGPAPERRMVHGKRIGLIGYGHIARALIELFRGWGVDIRVASRYPDDRRDVTFLPLEDVLKTSDVLIVTASLSDATHHLLNKENLALVENCLVLVNAARGAIIEEEALIEALRSKRIRKAMLDVFETEPLPDDSPLRTLPNVILTPHNVGLTRELMEAIPALTLRNALDVLSGQVPPSCRNPQAVEKWRSRAAA